MKRRPTAGATLSPVEREIVILLALGYTHRQIGEAMGYERQTMKNRVSYIYQHVGVRGSAALVAWAIVTGQINTPDIVAGWNESAPLLLEAST